MGKIKRMVKTAIVNLFAANYRQIKDLLRVRGVKGFDLVRTGDMSDGAYVMLDDFKEDGVAYSFGIGNDISWDEWIIGKGYSVYAFDHTIDSLPHENSKIKWLKMGIQGHDDEENRMISLNTVFDRYTSESGNTIVKMDIEGYEWEALETLSKDKLKSVSQISMELHGLTGLRTSRIIKVLEKIRETHTPIWIHGNNNAGKMKIGGDVLPQLLEVTFVNNEEYELYDIQYDCPTDLDRKNIENKDEIILNDWGTIQREK